MGARRKLNGAHLTDCLVVAGLIGALVQSWAVFAVVSALLAALDLVAGNVRPPGRPR